MQILSGGVSAIAANGDQSRFIKADGSLWVMGRNDYGQLGTGTTSSHSSPVQVLASGARFAACGADFSLFMGPEIPTVTVAATTAAAEPTSDGLFTLTRDSIALDQPLTVN